MIPTNTTNTLIHTFRDTFKRHSIYRTAVRLFLVSCIIGPSALLANSLNHLQDVTVSEQFALHQWPETATAPEPALERLGNQHILELAEEASKQAQAIYLAKKFRQRLAAVRKFVDLAWAEADKREGIDPHLLIAIMQKESSLRPKVQSRYGAQGLMQVVRRWHREKLNPSESLFDPVVNIRVGADILEEYLQLAGGSLPNALKKYSGNARGYSNRIIKESRKLAQLAGEAELNG